MFAIRTEDLTKDFSIGFWRPTPYRALDRLNLEVPAGETFGFLGPNGAGKTTTLKLLMQLIYPTSGRAEILQRPLGDMDVRRRIGYLPESPYFYDYLTSRDKDLLDLMKDRDFTTRFPGIRVLDPTSLLREIEVEQAREQGPEP